MNGHAESCAATRVSNAQSILCGQQGVDLAERMRSYCRDCMRWVDPQFDPAKVEEERAYRDRYK